MKNYNCNFRLAEEAKAEKRAMLKGIATGSVIAIFLVVMMVVFVRTPYQRYLDEYYSSDISASLEKVLDQGDLVENVKANSDGSYTVTVRNVAGVEYRQFWVERR